MFFWISLAFSMIQQVLAFWSLVPLSFLNPAWTSATSQFTYCWSLAWRILIITNMWDECYCAVVWAFFGTGMKTDPFQSCGHRWVFQICWHIECSTFTASSFRIWNGSPTGIPSPPLALFAVMLPKAHLTSLREGKHLPWNSLHSLSSAWGCHHPALIRPSNRQNFQQCPGLPSPSSLTFSTWRHFKSPHLCSPQREHTPV